MSAEPLSDITDSVYSVYDAKAAAYLPPFTSLNDDTATRAIVDCLTDPNHTFARHPEDFTLVRVGEWSSQNGYLLGQSIPSHVHKLTELLPKPPLDEGQHELDLGSPERQTTRINGEIPHA